LTSAPLPDTSTVWYFCCMKKYKSARGRPSGHRQLARHRRQRHMLALGGRRQEHQRRGGASASNLSTQDGEFVETSYGLLCCRRIGRGPSQRRGVDQRRGDVWRRGGAAKQQEA
jgi:hypothetical protein